MTAEAGPFQNVVQMHFRPRGIWFRAAGRRAFYAPDPPDPDVAGWYGRDLPNDSSIAGVNDWQGPAGISRWGRPILSYRGSVTRYWFQSTSGGSRETGGFNVYRWGRFYAQAPNSYELLGASLCQDAPQEVAAEPHTGVNRYACIVLDQVIDEGEEITVEDDAESAAYQEGRDWQRAIGGIYIPPQTTIPPGATIKISYTARPTWLQIIVYDAATPAERCYRQPLNGEEDAAGSWAEIGSRALVSGEAAPNPYCWNESGTEARSCRNASSSTADRYIAVQCAVSGGAATFSVLSDVSVSAAYTADYDYTDDGGGAWHGSADFTQAVTASVAMCYDYVGDTLVTGTVEYARTFSQTQTRENDPGVSAPGSGTITDSATVTLSAPDIEFELLSRVVTATYADDVVANTFDIDYDEAVVARAILALDIRHGHAWVLEGESSRTMDATGAAMTTYGYTRQGPLDAGEDDEAWRWKKVVDSDWTTVDTQDPGPDDLGGTTITLTSYSSHDPAYYQQADVSSSIAPSLVQSLRSIHDGAGPSINPASDYVADIVEVDGEYVLRLGGNLSSGVTDATFVDYSSTLDLPTVAGTATPGLTVYL